MEIPTYLLWAYANMLEKLEAREIMNLANAMLFGSGNMKDPELFSSELERKMVGAEPSRPKRAGSVEEMMQMMSQGPSGMNIATQ